jgi:hypothetical protein
MIYMVSPLAFCQDAMLFLRSAQTTANKYIFTDHTCNFYVMLKSQIQPTANVG